MAQLPPAPTPTFPYQLENEIGAGAMGRVYRATEPSLRRAVAIKMLRLEVLTDDTLAQEARQRFLQEARAAAALAHPGVTTIYRVGEEDGVPYIAMEWLAGQSLETLIETSGPLSIRQAAHLGKELASTLEVAHAAGVVHRDIKPANLVLLEEGPRAGRLKVTDFGIARVQNSDLISTQAGLVLATPKFASPEQLRSLDVDHRSDLFSAGIVLYYLLTGRYPFHGNTFMEVATAILRQDPVPPSEYNPKIPSKLEALVLRALRKAPEDRFQQAAELATALHPFSLDDDGDSGGWSGIALDDTVRTHTHVGTSAPKLTRLHTRPARMVAQVVQSWPARPLGRQSTSELLLRLQDRPLHAPPFAGAAIVGTACLLFEGGLILGALDLEALELEAPDRDETPASEDEIVETLPDEADVTLHPLPEPLQSGTAASGGPTQAPMQGLVRCLAGLLRPGKVRHDNLDSSFVHIPALADKLAQETFRGVLSLQRGEGRGYLLFDEGRIGLSLFTNGWTDVDVERSWTSWVSEVPVRASVFEVERRPVSLSLRQELRELDFTILQVTGVDDKPHAPVHRTSRVLQLLGTNGGGSSKQVRFHIQPLGRALEALPAALLPRDPSYRLLQWLLSDLPTFFHERDRVAAWKYLATWVFQVQRARLHHDLPRPENGSNSRSLGGQSNVFDLVTEDAEGKVLHLGQRVAHLTPEAFQHHLQRIIDAKTARLKNGDVGGALLLSPRIDDATLTAYAEATRIQGGGSWFKVEETLTGYAGFVRIGPRRGFHLLLVEEHADGSFHPLLPS